MIQVEFLKVILDVNSGTSTPGRSMGFVTETQFQNPLSFIVPALLTLRKLLNHFCACCITYKMGVIVLLLKV